jgi:hypothetical protein
VKSQDEQLHAELMRAFKAYFEENQKWQGEATHASSVRLRHRLSDIRRICSARRKDIREWQVEKLAQLKERKTKRLAQKGSTGGSEDGN